jgi:small subunit ribosomal protein S7
LKRYGKVFKEKKKKVIRKVTRDRTEKLILLNILFQNLITSGKRALTAKIFLNLFVLLKFKYKKEFVNNYIKCLEKIRPLIYYKLMYIGGKKYRIPVLMPISKSYSVATRWLINSSAVNGSTIVLLFNNINASLRNEGSAVKYRKEHHAASFENKAYIRFLKFLKGGF